MFNIIAACDDKNGIGRDGKIPWSDTEIGREDMREFRKQTTEGVVIMGRRTYESIGGPLANRCNIVVSRDQKYLESLKDGYNIIYTASSFEDALAIAQKQIEESAKSATYKLNGKIWVIGGSELYTEALHHPKLHRVYISRIRGDFECDVFMPSVGIRQIGGYGLGEVNVEIYGNADEENYLRLLSRLLTAPLRPNRTGIPTRGLFAEKLEFSLSRGDVAILPVLTTKRVPIRMVAAELLWFLSGKCTDITQLHTDGCHIWDGNTTREFLDSRGLTNYSEGECGPIYGYQWRSWNRSYTSMREKTRRKNSIEKADPSGHTSKIYSVLNYSVAQVEEEPRVIDQIAGVIKTLRTNPFDRRMIVSAWNPEQLDQMALPPCHWSFQFHCDIINESADSESTNGESTNGEQPKYSLNCLMNMRSADVALGVPFNITSYALLTHMIAKCVGMRPGKLVIMMADCHLYENHVEGAGEQVRRNPGQFPTITFRDDVVTGGDISQFTSFDQFVISGYMPQGTIKYPMAI
jgi:dihydrofolate reductase/thymidylate synthase